MDTEEDQQKPAKDRLLPDRLEDRIAGLAARCAGVVALIVAAALWASLLSWSLDDPSLSHATSGPTRNLMGQPGAIVADLLLNTLGFTAIVLLLAPMFWGGELVLHERIAGFQTKALLFPLSLLLMAGAVSAVPAPLAWPIRHGLGGILGDGINGLTQTLLGVLLPGRSGAVSGLVLFAAGFAVLARSIGQDVRDLLRGATVFLGAFTIKVPRRGEAASGDAVHTGSSVTSASPTTATTTSDVTSIARAFAPKRFAGAARPDPGPLTLEPEWLPDVHEGSSPHLPPEVDRPAPGQHTWSGAPTAAPDETAARRTSARAPDPTPMAAPRGVASEEDLGRALARRFAPRSTDSFQPDVRDLQRKASGFLTGLARQRAKPAYRRPSLNELAPPAKSRPLLEVGGALLRGQARLLEDTLADFGIKGEIRDVKPGPVVTLFELEPQRGTKAQRIVGLADDIARSMSATSARVAVVPGRTVVGIELPNPQRQSVVLRELLESDAYKSAQGPLPLALGRGIAGDAIVADLAQMPHLLVAGTTGSGKSVGINAMILSLIYARTPDECRLLLIDPKMLELSVYNGIPHLLTPVVTDPGAAVAALDWVVGEMEERYKRMARLGVRSIDVYNNRVRNAERLGEPMKRTVQTGYDARSGAPVFEDEVIALETMPYIVVVVDEFADLMMTAGKEIEAAVQRLSQMARAAGIHLVMATQRPSVDIITGTIKANFPSRIAFKVASRIDSRTILGEQGAEQLLGAGDMLLAPGSGQPLRVHGAYVSDEEVERVATALRQQGEPRYVDILQPPARTAELSGAFATSETGAASGGGKAAEAEALYEKAIAIVLREGKASATLVQRRLSIGYNKAADLIERMEAEGLVGPADASGRRKVLGTGPGTGVSVA